MVTVATKQTVAEGSSAFRHMVELFIRVLSEAGVVLSDAKDLRVALGEYRAKERRMRVLYLVSDGGPDHNVRFAKTRVTLEVIRWSLANLIQNCF